ncbi:MAG: glycosyltransferase [Phormidesmis sp.]
MKLEDVRLLIVVENADYRPHIADDLTEETTANVPSSPQTLPQTGGPAHLPTQLSPLTTDDDTQASSAVDLHILQAATYWKSYFQEVAIYAAYSPTAYSGLSQSGVRLIGSGRPSDAPNAHSSAAAQAQAPSHTETTATAPANDAETLSKQRNRLAGSASWPFTDTTPATKTNPERDRIRPIADYCPTHMVICTPSPTIISWATRNQISSVVLLCDWREPLGWWQRWQHKQLIKQLNQSSIAWIGSHGVYACKILCANGINPKKLIPWEWPQPQLPTQSAPKQLRYDRDTIKLLYVGPIHATAGVDDLLHAVSHLQQRGKAVSLQLICETSDEKSVRGAPPLPQPIEDKILGKPFDNPYLLNAGLENRRLSVFPDAATHSQGDDILGDDILGAPSLPISDHISTLDHDTRRLKALVQQLNLTKAVTFTPVRPEAKLLAAMRDADLAVMPGYDRDWPATTPPSLQLAMATRTPVIAADHHHFKEHLFHGVNAMIFPEGNPKSMAHRIERVMAQPQLYAQLSEALNIPLHAIKVPARWADLIDRWIQSAETLPTGTDNYQQLCNWAFSSGRYQGIPPMQKPPKPLKEKNIKRADI